jgi:hypothetical protein
MPTPNFNLPLINGASPISIVNDMNSLASAADSAMGTLATQGDISAANTKAQTALDTATKAQSEADKASAAAKTANDAAATANSTALAAQSSANDAQQSANSAYTLANTIQNGISASATYTKSGSYTLSDSNYTAVLYVSDDKQHAKLIGDVVGTKSKSAIPGLSGFYGAKLTTDSPLGAVRNAVEIPGVGFLLLSDGGIYSARIAVGTDGNIYLDPTKSNATLTSVHFGFLNISYNYKTPLPN